jgi:tetratricopeptide (TPR) repeat protein
MTPFTSFLVLESQQAYRDRGMPIRQRFRWGQLDQGDDGTAIATGPATLPLLGLGGCMALGSEAEDSPVHEGKSAQTVTEKPPTSSPVTTADPAPAMPVAGSEEVAEAEPAQPAYDSPKKSSKSKPRRGPPAELDDLIGGKDKSGGDWESTGGSGSGYGGGGKISGAPQPDATLSRLLAELGDEAKRIGGLGTTGPAGSYRGDGAKIAITNPYVEPEQAKPKFNMRSCSDASRRPLYHRRILWQRRLAHASQPNQYLRIFSEAGERCELPNWRARKVLLDLIEGRVRTPEQVNGLIAAFSRYRGAQSYLRRRIMRHALDPDLTMGLWFGHPVNWGAVKRGLIAIKEPAKRLEELRKIMEKHPSDPAGRNLLVATLFDAGENDDARAEAARLRRDGLANPVTLAILCDLQAAAGLEDDAQRSCSELVEFNADDTTARQRLGDLFLRHGWYGAAYRQYRTLVDVLGGSEPAAQLRLAAAAAGMGKVDEALRIERKVSSGDGEPGPADPRRWARLHSAVRLSRMILEAGAGDGDKIKALERSLKRTQVAGTPTTLVVLVWEDLEAVLELVAEVDDEPFAVSDRVVSPGTGLMMLDVGETPPEGLELGIKLRSGKLKRAVGYSLVTIVWDGKSFTLKEKRGELPADEEELSLSEAAPAEVASAEG